MAFQPLMSCVDVNCELNEVVPLTSSVQREEVAGKMSSAMASEGSSKGEKTASAFRSAAATQHSWRDRAMEPSR